MFEHASPTLVSSLHEPPSSSPLPYAAGQPGVEMQRRPVLVIDDDQDIRGALRDLLSDEGYAVTLAGDGAEGLRMLARAEQPMVVLLDLMMPRVDGYEVCRRLAADPRLRDDHAIVLMSARRNLEAADQTAVTAAIPKPFEINELLSLLDRLAGPPPH